MAKAESQYTFRYTEGDSREFVSKFFDTLRRLVAPDLTEADLIKSERGLDETLDSLIEYYHEGELHAMNCEDHGDMSEIDRRRALMGGVTRILKEAMRQAQTPEGRHQVWLEAGAVLATAVYRLATGSTAMHPEPEERPTEKVFTDRERLENFRPTGIQTTATDITDDDARNEAPPPAQS